MGFESLLIQYSFVTVVDTDYEGKAVGLDK